MCVPSVPAKPKADFSIDFIVGNNNNSKSASNNNTISRRSAMSPLSARQATPPHPYSRPTSPPMSSSGLGSPGSASEDDDLHIRARLFGLQGGLQGLQQSASLPGAGALHPGLLHHHMSLPGLPREPPTSPTTTATPSPPHSPPHQMQQPFLLRGLYRPEPMMVPQMHPHLPGPPPHLMHPGVHMGPHGPMAGPPKDSYPLYPWLLSRHGRIFPHRFPGVAGPDFAGFLLHPFRKPKRIRTAFSPSQLLKLEHAFENNHYVVGAERKQVAQALGLSETQVKVWFQNRRTKHKRTEQEEEAKQRGSSKQESSSSPSQAASWKDDSSQRPVDLSSQDDSSEGESES